MPPRWLTMTRALVLVMLAARVVSADPLHDFAAQWPNVSGALAKRHADRLLWEGHPCDGAFEQHRLDPAMSDLTPAEVSPDGNTLVAVPTIELDKAGLAALGITGASTGPATFVLVFDGPTGKIWGRPLESFMSCVTNKFAFTWSADSHRVFFGVDTGHGSRDALVDLVGRALRIDAFTGADAVSPGVEHLAWTPWFSGYPFADRPADGDVLEIDGREVWGSTKPGAANVWALAWTSDRELTFCGSTPKLGPTQFRAVVNGKTPIVVKRIGDDCPQRNE